MAATNAPHSNEQPRLLFVFLRGGMDANNLLVPTSSSFYYESRPGIAIAKPSSDLASALPLTSDWGLHPALRDTVYPLWQQGEAAFVPFSGTHDISRSHFETQDSIELGQWGAPRTQFGSGFLNRLASVLGQGSAQRLASNNAAPIASPIAFTDQLPVAMQGDLRVPNVSLRNLAKPSVDARQSQLIASMYQGTPLQNSVRDGFAVRDQVLQALREEMDAASRGAISAKGFELEARRIARLLREDYRIGFVDIGGWDTHVAQGGATGYLASRLDELGQGLATLARELGPVWRSTVVVVMSEFGRTFRENGNRGTDHGHGSVMWVLGGGVRGQQVVGQQQAITANTLFQNRDMPVLNEYRSVLAGLFTRQWGLSASQLQTVFPGYAGAVDVGLV
ncbi:DUF1501 domain-containing protein [Curvibacter sp. CHRR-16]|uniref:DUF1501 domain-containing protein n=1 Tax=Curvibacter sp. CHRR-16 TaxID=2835872 RepID=UPI002023B4C7|nr:DUF1501 domain-containing protein [Curvibacter sp. CHRR-16]